MMKRDLSNVHISAEEKSRPTMENVRCSICDEVLAKSVICVCDSGQWAQQTFQKDSITPNHDPSGALAGLVHCCSSMMVSRCEVLSLRNKDFASGDHHHCSKCFRQIPTSKSLNNIEVNRKLPRNIQSVQGDEAFKNNNTETTIKYKNVNFAESESLLSVPCSNEHGMNKKASDKPADTMHRPITCPISACRKMIARASILQHFIFDHSKVPRITLNIDEIEQAFVNIAAINKEIRCYAVLLVKIDAPLVHTVDSNTFMNGGHKNASFLLMGARMQSAEIIKKPHGGKRLYIRHAQTQTEAPAKSSKISLISNVVEDSIIPSGRSRYCAEHNVILLWICKLVHDVTFYYTISVRSSDRKLGYSFTGETLNVGDFHELPMYGQVECLRILEKASIKLINEQNELEVIVNIFK